jgi:hypothetical protein
MRVSLVLLVSLSCFLSCTAVDTLPACPTPSTTSIRCIRGNTEANIPAGGLCKCKCTRSSGYVYNYYVEGASFSALGLTSVSCTSASCAANVGLQSVCSNASPQSNDPYVSFTPEFVSNINIGDDYESNSDYSYQTYSSSRPLGAGTICAAYSYTCTAAMAAANYCEDSLVGSTGTGHFFFNTSSTDNNGNIVGATAACESFRTLLTAYKQFYPSVVFCTTDSCNTKDAASVSSSSVVKPASLGLVILLLVSTFF